MLKGEESRRFIRVLLDIPCEFSLKDNLKEKNEGKIIELSISSIFLEAKKEMHVGENLKFYIKLPNELHCEFFGQVARKVGKKEYGIKFEDIDELTRLKLGDFIIDYLAEQNRVVRLFMQVKRSENK